MSHCSLPCHLSFKLHSLRWDVLPITYVQVMTHFSSDNCDAFCHFQSCSLFQFTTEKATSTQALSAKQEKNTVILWYDFFHKILELTMVKAPALNVVSPLWKSMSITSLISNEKFCSTQYLLKNNTQQGTSWRKTQTLSHSPNSCTLLHTLILLCKVSSTLISATFICHHHQFFSANLCN